MRFSGKKLSCKVGFFFWERVIIEKYIKMNKKNYWDLMVDLSEKVPHEKPTAVGIFFN